MTNLRDDELDRAKRSLDLREEELNRREAELIQLAREVAAEHDRVRALRTDLLQRIAEQRRQQTSTRWPTGPRTEPSLVSEDDWWAKMLGRERSLAGGAVQT